MAWQGNIYFWPLIINAVLSAVISGIAWQRRKVVPGARTVTALMHANAVWAVLYAFELSVSSLQAQIWLAKLEYIGILSIPPLWLLFAVRYTRRSGWLTRSVRLTMAIIPFFLFAMVMTNEMHHLVWTATEQVQVGQSWILLVTHGPGFFAIITYSYLNMLLGGGLLALTWLEAPASYRRQLTLILLGAIAPWLGNFLYISKLNPFPELDLTPFAFTFTGLMGAWGIARYNLLGVIPLARSQAVDNMSEAIVVLDTSGLVVDTNPAGRRLATNGLADGPSGVSFRAAFSEWPELVQLLGDRDDGQADLLHPATQQTFAVQVAPIREPGVEGCRLVTLRDVTERIRIEADLRQARDLAESASNAKSAFLATISHELRTPLTVIMGYSEMLLEEARAAEQDETALRLERIKTSGQHLLDLVNDVLDLSRMEAGRLLLDCHWFDVRDLLQQAEALGRPLAEQNGNTLEVVCEEPLGQMFSDMTRVRQVLINLLSNAARFTQRGSIRLQVKRYVETDGCDWLSFSVTDSGIGMSGDQMSGLFQPFSQVESPITRRQGGAGLGLAISRRLCQMLGGDISVRSQAGKGSTFTVLLPASTPQS